jgi:hypothetical protein
VTTQLERAVRSQWARQAAQVYAGTCDSCGRNRDDEGKFLIVARQPHRRERECLACYSKRTGND